jgi:hypothetical protein
MAQDAGTLVFVEQLMLLPLVKWRDAAMACPRQLPAATARVLDAAIRDPVLALDVWNTRDDVETALYRFDCAEGQALLRGKAHRTHVHVVSERAALAVLVHAALSAEDFGACYGGFEGCIARATLHLH